MDITIHIHPVVALGVATVMALGLGVIYSVFGGKQ